MDLTILSGSKSVIRAPIRFVDNFVDPVTRTLKVRTLVKNNRRELKPGMYMDVVLQVSLGRKLAIPQDALLDTGTSKLVFVDKGEGHFEPREVRVGIEANDFYEVIEGLTAGESVVVSANFLVDSESRLRAAVRGMGESQKT